MRQRRFYRRITFDVSIEDEAHIACIRADLEKRHARSISTAEAVRVSLSEAAARRGAFPPPLEEEAP